LDTKQTIIDLVNVCYAKGIRKVVFSPGSRNAPLIIAFNEHKGFECFAIPDERVAAFFGLGMAQQTHETVAIVSTSGSAALNYSPAIAEAYYQRIPMLVLTADRPPEWIDQGNGQTMRQRNLYQNFIKKSYEINHETTHPDELWYNVRIYNEAINETRIEAKGPVHINLPLREPLYDFKLDFNNKTFVKIIDQVSPPPELSTQVLDSLSQKWNQSSKKLILCGITPRSQALNDLLSTLSADPSVIILTETTSNVTHPNFIEQLDRVLFTIEEKDGQNFKPEILLTFGTKIVAKKIKTLFRNWDIEEHWHLDESDIVIDTFKSLTSHLRSDLVHFFKEIIKRTKHKNSTYAASWHKQDQLCKRKHESFLATLEWSDLKAYEICLNSLPENSNLQMANSTAVRYVQLMSKRADISYYSNRGVAGIDGCSSTAAGAAWVNVNKTILVTGDVAFFYDSNALWTPYLKKDLRIILFNNQGGNIFRFIPGPDSTEQLETFFEAHHNKSARHLAAAYDIAYFSADNEAELTRSLPSFWQDQTDNKPAILEIFTPRLKNAQILKSYFRHLL
jgi:2-succinyl-5-enolpyruvyl-6-hydroxy-3-cyclohexene-1-carboxylate synthase